MLSERCVRTMLPALPLQQEPVVGARVASNAHSAKRPYREQAAMVSGNTTVYQRLENTVQMYHNTFVLYLGHLMGC